MWLLVVALAAARRGGGLAAPSPPLSPSGAQCLGSVCFGLFWEARSFPEARSVCEGGGGHLMTVRSTVAGEAIAVLLGDRSGSAWLGLRLPEGSCAETAKQLRGFRWVTGDERTDYQAWASAAAAVCGPRCVVVNQRLRWEESACDVPADGFLCEYSYPGGTCAPLALPPAATVSYLTPFGARESDLVASPPGTTAEVPSLNAILECRAHSNGSLGWGSASPSAWDCRLENGGCEGQCRVDDGGRPFCTCPEGATLSGEDKRSCSSPCASLGCQHHCVPQGDSAVCMCSVGYVLDADGRSCKDVDDCQATPSPCEQQCINTQGGFKCLCYEDYELVEGKCRATKWECFDLSCQHECKPVNGQYRCTCNEGYMPHPQKPNECVMSCNQTKCLAECDPYTFGSCFCADGFIWEQEPDGTNICTDLDECENGDCGELECINTPGSYHCICPKGKVCDETESSGETETYSTLSAPTVSVPTLAPTKDVGGRGMLVAVIVGSTFAVIALVAILCYLVKKHCAVQTMMDYKCQRTETGVPLQHVSLSTDRKY
ncbi:thrombomodulin [Rhineura floridana]|uniref:thrombomodulin n=1 Tax=Rhineura floridana TaxID=261503 RepID=UPI002AC81BE5|nr:thrombomodulin [Rhineura floridana]